MPLPFRLRPISLLALAAAVAMVAGWLGIVPGTARADGPPDAINMDTGWRLQIDTNAPWKDDPLFLPDEVTPLAHLPLNQPTGGWTALDDKAGITVSLPATVEQFYWGKAPNKVLDPKRVDDVVNFDGTYQGVSWWYRMFQPPELKSGQSLVLTFPGTRLRAEVYVNGQLVGYNLVAETPFSADITRAIIPGAPNQLAVRVTDPGGNLSHADDTLIPWGKYGIPVSHGFGGLDGGVTLSVRAPVAVSDVAVSNHTDARAVTITAEVTSSGPPYDGPVVVSILRDGKEVFATRTAVQVRPGGSENAVVEARVPDAELWDVGHPALYTARARLDPDDHTARDATFGFRWFSVEGVGKDARLFLNGHRIVIKSANSWGFWAPNGLFPDRAAAERETAAVQSFGLNAIQNSRHFPKPAVLDAFDRAGLLRWCEPGGGIFALRNTPEGGVPKGTGPIDTSGDKPGEATWFNRYATAKTLAMVRAYRSHPSVIAWSLLSGTDPGDPHNPKLYATLRRMHELDPSRITILKGGPAANNQAWLAPYGTEFQFDNGKGGSGWRDEHTPDSVPGIPPIPGHAVAVYQDGMYRAPDDFAYRATDDKAISMWGEMAAGASPDNHTEMNKWYEKNGGTGYSRAAHDVLADAYEKALDRYDFRKAFPTAEALFHQIAAQQSLLSARLLENARLSNVNDYVALAGWESTTTDAHSGLVDALRHPKGDPAVVKAALAPTALVVRPRHEVVPKGEAAAVDVYLLNETNLKGPFYVGVSATLEGEKKPFFEENYSVNLAGGERFAQLLKDNVTFTPPKPGLVKVTATMMPVGGVTTLPVPVTRTEPLLVVDPSPEPLKRAVALVPGSAPIGAALEAQLGIKTVAIEDAKGKADDLLVDTNLWQYEHADRIDKADDPNLYREQFSHGPGDIATVRDLAPGPLKVELFFAETRWERPGQRVFDVALNGNTVLEKFDILQDAGGKRGVAVVKTFTVDSKDGALVVSVPKADADRAQFAALRVTDSKKKVVSEVFRSTEYTGKGGKWKPVELAGFDWKPVLPGLLEKVRAGSRLVVLSSGGSDAAQNAAALAEAKVLTYNGTVGPSGPSSMGFWYFGKKHWLLDGLPNGGAGVLDWPCQITSGNGLLLSAPGLEAVVAYGRDHAVEVGLGAAVVPLGKGQIVLLNLRNLEETFVNNLDLGFHPVTARRILYNALHGEEEGEKPAASKSGASSRSHRHRP